MKKILVILLLLINMVMFAPNVNAATFTTSMSGASVINKGATFSVNVNVNTTSKIFAMKANLNFVSSKVKFISAKCSWSSSCGVTGSTTILVDSSSSRSGNFTMFTVTFQALTTFTAGQSTSISISNVSGTYDNGGTPTDFNGTGSSRTITVAVPKSSNNNLASLKVDGTSVPSFSASTTSYNLGSTDKSSISISASVADPKASASGTGTKTLVYGPNEFPVVVRAENGSTKTYMINITRTDPRSTNNFLSAITLSAGTIVFNKDTGNYSVVVENNVTSITIGATVADAKSTLTGPGTFDLKVYSNVFVLSVKAENGAVRTYTVDIVRKDELGFSKELSNDNALATLTIEGIDLAFKPETTNYVLNVDTAITSVKINATVRNSAAKASFPATATLDFGQNVVNVTVTAENGEKRIYALFIYRKSEAPIVSIDDILTTLETTTAKTIILVPGISGVIPKEVLDKAAQKGIVIIVEKRDDLGRVIYIWTFTGVATDTRTNINTNLSFASPDAETILGLANYADGLILNFSHSGAIAPGTKVKIYVGAQFEDGMKLNLYLYDKVKGKLNLSVEEVVVLKGFVELDMTHASEYFLTRSTIKDTKADPIFFLATVAEAGLILSLLLFMFLRRKRKTA